MSKGLVRSIARGPKARAPIVRQAFPVNDVTVTVDGATGVGFGTSVIGDFPAGNLLILGGVAYLQFLGTTVSMTDTWTGNFSVGSTATADATLDTTDVDLIASSAISAATALLSPVTRGVNATQAMLDNTDGSLEVNLNLTVADASISADDVPVVANGYVELVYIVLGDD